MFDKTLFKIKGMRGVFAVLLVSAIVQAALAVTQAAALALALSRLCLLGDLAGQVVPIGVFLASFLGRRVVTFAQDELLDSFAAKRTQDLRGELLGKAFGNQLIANDVGTAAVTVAVTKSIDDVARYLRVIPPKACGLVGTSAPILAALFAIDWVSGVIALVTFPVIALFMVMLGRQARARASAQYEEGMRLSNHFMDALRGIGTLHSLGAIDREASSVHASSEQLRVATVRTLSVATLSSAMLDLISVFGIAAIAMMLAFRLMDGSMGLEPALVALMLAPEFFAPIRQFAGDFHASLDGKSALADVMSMLDNPVTAPEEGRAPAWSAESDLVATDVSYRYESDGPDALRHVSFACHGFENVAIVGPSGAGKSTLADLIAGLRESANGSFSIDGVETATLSASSWRGQLHYIPQHPHLFNGTLADNIRFYRPDASRGEIERAAHLVGLDELVAQLPQGLDTPLGEGAHGLSGGQAHRVALARVLLDDRKIVVFDEPTAHLDLETELELKERMLACMEGRLAIIATHRLHWLTDMDRVIVIEDGAVAASGTVADALAQGSALGRLVENAWEGTTR